jgi:hypothetical protein
MLLMRLLSCIMMHDVVLVDMEENEVPIEEAKDSLGASYCCSFSLL